MKKILLTIAVTLLVTTAWSQSQLNTIRGKTKDGKTIKVEYYQGSVEDYVESVKYQLVDELQARVTDLQGKLDAANKQLKDLKNTQTGNASSNNAEIKRLNNEINDLNKALDNLQGQLVASELSNDSLVAANSDLQKQVEKANKAKPIIVETNNNNNNNNEEDLKRLRDSIVSKDATIRKLNNSVYKYEKQVGDLEKNVHNLEKELATAYSAPTGLGKPMPVIGVVFGIGPAFMRDDLGEGWTRNVSWAKKAGVYFGTARMAKSFPFSIEAGIGIRSYALSANGAACEQTMNAIDADGDAYQAIYNYSNRTERLGLTYLDIPVRACFGQPDKKNMSVYAKVGITPSIKVSSSFTGTGNYSLKGYYPQWDVTLENIEELGFGNNLKCYDEVEPDLNGFILWGNLMLGGYMPFGNSPLLLNAGLGLDIPFMGAGSATEGMHLLGEGGKAVIPSFEIGLVISLK